jgi:hypothetical protein
MSRVIKMAKRKKPLTCPVCKKKFSYSAKAHPIGRLSKHIAKEHPKYKRKKTTKSVPKQEQLLDELQLFDDYVATRLMGSGTMSQPTEHQQIAGTIISAIKLGYALAKGGQAVAKGVKTIKKKRSSK